MRIFILACRPRFLSLTRQLKTGHIQVYARPHRCRRGMCHQDGPVLLADKKIYVLPMGARLRNLGCAVFLNVPSTVLNKL